MPIPRAPGAGVTNIGTRPGLSPGLPTHGDPGGGLNVTHGDPFNMGQGGATGPGMSGVPPWMPQRTLQHDNQRFNLAPGGGPMPSGQAGSAGGDSEYSPLPSMSSMEGADSGFNPYPGGMTSLPSMMPGGGMNPNGGGSPGNWTGPYTGPSELFGGGISSNMVKAPMAPPDQMGGAKPLPAGPAPASGLNGAAAGRMQLADLLRRGPNY